MANIQIRSAEFVKSVFKPAQLPQEKEPEAAFAGRSNVGKSSLLNRLLQRKKLVKISSRPGFTQSINFFLVNGAVYFVDLPGYGFAKAPKRVQKKWGRLVASYLEGRKVLKGVICIFDIRRIPDQKDLELVGYLKSLRIKPVIVLNKADKLSQPKRKKQKELICAALTAPVSTVHIVSARTGEGCDKVRDAIWSLLTE